MRTVASEDCSSCQIGLGALLCKRRRPARRIRVHLGRAKRLSRLRRPTPCTDSQAELFLTLLLLSSSCVSYLSGLLLIGLRSCGTGWNSQWRCRRCDQRCPLVGRLTAIARNRDGRRGHDNAYQTGDDHSGQKVPNLFHVRRQSTRSQHPSFRRRTWYDQIESIAWAI